MSAEAFAFLRDVLATALFVPTCYLAEKRRPEEQRQFWPRREHWGHMIALGVMGVWGAQLLGALAISKLSATTYGLLSPTVPVITLLVSLAVGIDSFMVRSAASWLKVSGIVITVTGAIIIVVLSASSDASQNTQAGFVYILIQKVRTRMGLSEAGHEMVGTAGAASSHHTHGPLPPPRYFKAATPSTRNMSSCATATQASRSPCGPT